MSYEFATIRKLNYFTPMESQFVLGAQISLCLNVKTITKTMFELHNRRIILNTHLFWFFKDNVFVLIMLCVIIG